MRYKFEIKNYGDFAFNTALIKCVDSSKSMAEAAYKLGVKYDTFRKYAVKLGVFKSNQPGKGIKKKPPTNKIPLVEILDGKHPSYGCSKLRVRLLKAGIKEKKCEECNIKNWNNKEVRFELHHVDNDRFNHKLENLKILCPNCHSQTEYFRRNKTPE